ncbi:MAG: Flp pilus assembly complex ATPase component TadA [Fibrobacteraceae bacterium]|nr:Flp pilus assembly complex ATPase component TadA [Fibrobacteraceae bacterium]
MRNQYMAKVLVHNKLVTEDQVNAYWGQVSSSMDIGQLLVAAGLLKPTMYEKVLAYVQNLEAKATAAAASAAAEPTKPSAPVPPSVTPRPTAAMAAVAASEEPALQIEGNNIFGESSSASVSVEIVSGLETTSISSFQIASDVSEESTNGGSEELPTRFAVATGEGTPVEAPENLSTNMPLKKMIAFARKFGATDIYLYAGRQIVMSQSGNLFLASEDVMDKGLLTDLLSEIAEGFSDGYKIVMGKNFSKTMGLAGVGRARVTVTWNEVTPSIAIRVIQMESTTLENLYLPSFCEKFAELQSGLVLIAGPTASGRTTTMTTFAETIAESRQVYIQTIEKPIERLLKNPNGAIAQREVGLHVRSGISGIEMAIRDGADVILFDHLESMDELKLLLQASNSGALVFAVTHGNNIHALLSRLLASVPEISRATFAYALADQLKGVIVQHLVPVVQNQGLIMACEAMRVSSTIANIIRKGDLSQIAAAVNSQKDQGISLDESLQKCVESGYIDGAEAWKRATDSRRFAAYRPENHGGV